MQIEQILDPRNAKPTHSRTIDVFRANFSEYGFLKTSGNPVNQLLETKAMFQKVRKPNDVEDHDQTNRYEAQQKRLSKKNNQQLCEWK